MIKKLISALHFLEDSALVSLVILMLVLSCSPFILRNFGVSGMTWTDTAVRISVLWLAIFGAMRASREQSHISIDLVSHYTPKQFQLGIHFIISLFCSAMCAIASYYSLIFIQGEKEEGSLAFLNIPVWLCEAIIPFGLAIIALRFLIHSLTLPLPHEQSINEHSI